MPSLAFLIPARNERETLPRLLASLREQCDEGDEIWVCDDESEDGTTEWLQANAESLGVRWFRSQPRPEGWVGKNWACHQLAQHAQAEWLVFLDADMQLECHFVQVLRQKLTHTPAQLVSGIPTLQAPNLAVGLLKAMLPFSIFTLLPLYCAERVPNPAFAFANGQVMAMRREDYMRLQPHAAVRQQVLEDVAIAALVKRHRGRVVILDLRPYLKVQMYRTLGEAFRGLAKNAVAICRGVPMALTIALMLAVVYLMPLFSLLWSATPLVWGAVGLSALIYGASARMAGLPLWYGVFYPVGVALGIATLLYSVRWYLRGEVYWKGRAYRTR